VPADAPASASATPRLPSPAEQAAEIARLKRELDRTRQEREVLKKAIAIFSEAPR
jgi:transposase